MNPDLRKPSFLRVAVAALCSLAVALPYQLAFAGAPGAAIGAGSLAPARPLVTEAKHGHGDKNVYVKKNVYVSKNIYVNKGGKKWYVKRWNRKPYYGNVIAGVALGTLIGVTAAGIAPVAPAPNLCWYWTNAYMNQGYWDYCY